MSMQRKGFQNQTQNNRTSNNPIDELIRKIRNASTLKEVFIPEKYALPGGWADSIASILINDDKKKQDKNKKKASMNSNQLRKIFTELKNIQKNIETEQKNIQENMEKDEAPKSKDENFILNNELKNQILLLMPQIAYARGRELISESFYNLLKECISSNKIVDKKDYDSFVEFYTAVVAYSKMYNK